VQDLIERAAEAHKREPHRHDHENKQGYHVDLHIGEASPF
jgi:hypothetical protein